MKWKMKDGKSISVKDMKDPHIVNCIKMLKEQIKQLNNINIPFPCFQGNVAQYYAEQDFNRLEDNKIYTIAISNEWIEIFKKELNNRNRKYEL